MDSIAVNLKEVQMDPNLSHNDENDNTLVATNNHNFTGPPRTPVNLANHTTTYFDTVIKKSKLISKTQTDEQYAVYKIKLDIATKTLKKIEDFVYSLKEDDSNSFKCKYCMNATSQNTNNLNGSFMLNDQKPEINSEILRERDSLRREVRELENGYSSLFKRYEKMREDCVLLKNNEEELMGKIEEEKSKNENLCERYADLRDNASEQLERANYEIERQAKQHDEATLSLRCRVRKYESELQAMNLTLQAKDTQIEELNKLCEELMSKNGISDFDSVTTDNDNRHF